MKKFLFACLLLFWSSLEAEKKCIYILKNDQILIEQGFCDQQYPPCSTFKIAISLMGFDSGILMDETHPLWDYKQGYVGELDSWKSPHDPALWFKHSCVWYSQRITEKLGKKRFSHYTKLLQYGNQDVSGDEGKENGLTRCWLSSSLKISPKQQVTFLQKLFRNELPVSQKAHEMTKEILYLEDLPFGWKLYGKTGNGSQITPDGLKLQDRQLGWFVGFASKGSQVITFAYLILDEDHQETYASLRAKAALKTELTQLIKNH